jgi:hypothetical protein
LFVEGAPCALRGHLYCGSVLHEWYDVGICCCDLNSGDRVFLRLWRNTQGNTQLSLVETQRGFSMRSSSFHFLAAAFFSAVYCLFKAPKRGNKNKRRIKPDRSNKPPPQKHCHVPHSYNYSTSLEAPGLAPPACLGTTPLAVPCAALPPGFFVVAGDQCTSVGYYYRPQSGISTS